MKKLLFILFAGLAVLFTSCLETTQEITLKDDGSGTYVNINDMGKVLTIAKNMGAASSDKMPQRAIDTSISFASGADSIPGLSAEDKELLKKGTLHLQMNVEDEKLITTMSFPFSTLGDIQKFNHLSGKMMMESMKGKMPGEMPMGSDAMPEPSSFDDYYTLEFSNGELKKKLDKEKYANVDKDEFLNGIKQAGAMGIPVTSTYIINLPHPAEKAEGKNVKLSDDKMKVTISSTMDDFYDNPEKLEFKIKY
ncbi:MAG TPA: hypothetical protein VIV35_11870 [Chitinophagaceae bacterium]